MEDSHAGLVQGMFDCKRFHAYSPPEDRLQWRRWLPLASLPSSAGEGKEAVRLHFSSQPPIIGQRKKSPFPTV
jgi:hypothetical protein